MIRRPPRSTLFPLHDALPISEVLEALVGDALRVGRVPERGLRQMRAADRLARRAALLERGVVDRKSTRLNSSHANISYAVFCLKKKKYWSITIRLRSRLVHTC